MPQSDYDVYVRTEWELFKADPPRAGFELEAASGINVRRVLDVGCGAGQMMAPFVEQDGVFGVGIDLSEEVGRAGRELFATYHPRARIAFGRARAEALPLKSGSVDLVICRLALPYTDNVRALGEMARVLRPGGRLLLRIHHWRFYLNEMLSGVSALKPRVVVHDVRVLLAGALYSLTGRQPRNAFVGTESFQTNRLVRRELARYGLAIQREMPDSTSDTPSYIIEKLLTYPAAGQPS
ncbi:MAG TPA: class I SAM-dependent methyltransferase [Vicinamibacterales bacterium]|nr:class I SAM-dependent methyltransferase [Vicinamibacterales bacterium]